MEQARYIPSLTPLRGIAAILVVFSLPHFSRQAHRQWILFGFQGVSDGGFVFHIERLCHDPYIWGLVCRHTKEKWFFAIYESAVFLFVFWSKNLLPDPLAIPVFSLMILQAAYIEGSVKKWLNCSVLTYLGDISYSIYLVGTHDFDFDLVRPCLK